jgi:drug/metabolite transporter (DMT)-like permease
MNMPPSQNRSNCAFRYGFLRLATDSTAQSGLKGDSITGKGVIRGSGTYKTCDNHPFCQECACPKLLSNVPDSIVRLERKRTMYQAQLRWKPIVALLIITLVWGANWAIVKIGARELAPLFMAGLRSLVAAGCLYVWMKIRRIRVFPSRGLLFHGIVIGFFFGTEFGFLYVGLQYTLASRTYVMLYTAPFFTALGAHLFLKGDELNPWKASGLFLAFTGVVMLFMTNLGPASVRALPGDLMALAAGALWGATTVYIKKYLAHRTVPLQTLFYQVLFSAPLLLIVSVVLKESWVSDFSLVACFSLFYQCIIVAFLSYLVWFELIHRYPVSLLHAFSFFTPVFGVFLSGVLILGEVISTRLILALTLVSVGIILVNRQPVGKG